MMESKNENSSAPLAQPPAGLPVELVGVRQQLDDNAGFWHSCSGCHDTEDGYPTGNYSHSAVFGCALGSGCHECGGLGATWDNNDYSEEPDDAAAPLAVPVPAEQSAPTDLSKRLREWAGRNAESGNFAIATRYIAEAADEIERYYGGMLAWKKSAKEADARANEARSALAVAGKEGEQLAGTGDEPGNYRDWSVAPSPVSGAPKPFAYFVQPSGFGPFIECKPSQIGCFPAYRAAGIAQPVAPVAVSEDQQDAARLDFLEHCIKVGACVWLNPCGADMRFVQVRSYGECENFPTVEGGVREAIDAAIESQRATPTGQSNQTKGDQ
jgi:hypothetical protein